MMPMNLVRKLVKRASRINGWSLFVVILAVAILVSCIVLFIAGWLYKWWYTKVPDLPIMKDFIAVLTGTAAVTGVVTFSRYLVDKDHDGVPDELEKANLPPAVNSILGIEKKRGE